MKVHSQLTIAVEAARSAGDLIRRNLRSTKKIDDETQHDIKLALDVRCQKLIERLLAKKFPDIALLGEEGVAGKADSELRWVVDPIDGTVNFTYGIPHACVSIALQKKVSGDNFKTVLGVVYDPFCDELWTAIDGGPAKLNGRAIRVSTHKNLEQSIVSIGFAKSKETLQKTLPYFNQLVPRIRKIRMMGSAALALTYVASGRFDAYIEGGIRLWDIAAGGFIIERAGGEFWSQPTDNDFGYRIIASNGLLRKKLEEIEKKI